MPSRFKVLLILGIFALRAAFASADATFPTTYGGPGNSFNAQVGGSADFTVSGSGFLHLSSPPILGTWIPIDGTVVLPEQTTTIEINANVSSTPSGNGTIQLQDLYNGQSSNISAPPGPDGKADDGTVADSQMSGTISSLDVNLLDAPQTVGISSVELSGAAGFTIFDNPVSIPISVNIDPSVVIEGLNYSQIGVAIMNGQVPINPGFADGAHPNVPGAENLSTQYNLVVSSGTLSGEADAAIGVEFSADFGVLGSYVRDLGQFSFDAGSVSEEFGLIGIGRFLQIAMAANGMDYDDLQFQLGGDLDSLIGPLTIPVTLTGTVPITESFEVPIDLGTLGTITFDGTFSGSITYTLAGTLTFSEIAYALQSQQIADAVNVPEASSITLLAVAGFAGIGLSHHRRKCTGNRRRKSNGRSAIGELDR